MTSRIIQGLPTSFHESFFPDRRHLASVLKLASHSFTGNLDDISAETGIPTGKSSGKVAPHLKYAHAMGMIKLPSLTDGSYALQRTGLGQLFGSEDPLLHEPLTQLILHLMLSRPIGGAPAWHVLFGRSRLALGRISTVDAIAKFLTNELGNSSALPGPIFATYREEASLARTGMLDMEKEVLTRGSLPSLPEYYWAYAYVWLTYWEQCAPTLQQMPLSELEATCGFVEVSGWTDPSFDDFLAWATEQGIVRIDRQTGLPLIMKMRHSDEMVGQIYSDLL